jgi:hypothetical protein
MPSGWPKQCYQFDPVHSSTSGGNSVERQLGAPHSPPWYAGGDRTATAGSGGCLKGTALKVIHGANLAATLELACNACLAADDFDDDRTPLGCVGWTVVDNTTATLFSAITSAAASR